MGLGIFYQDTLQEYDFGEGHPFRGDRYQLFPPFLRDMLPDDEYYTFLAADFATDADLLMICREEYITFTREYYAHAHRGSITPALQTQFPLFQSGDNKPGRHPGRIEDAARLIIGQTKRGIDCVQRGDYRKVVSIGGGMHHAKPQYGEGFCIYNDVAFAGTYLLEHYRLHRIVIIDTDAHAGNGTADYFYHDPRVLFIDLHQDPLTLYPGTGFISDIGAGEGQGYTINVPLPRYAGYESYQLVFDTIIQPVTEEFQPEIIIRNGGSDPHFADTLTQLGLPVRGFRMIGERIRDLATLCHGKEVDLIASGYNTAVLPYAWLALLSGLQHIELSIPEPLSTPPPDMVVGATKRVIDDITRTHREYWRCFH